MSKKEEAKNLIQKHGGTSAVARLCEISPQAVSQWKQKGIPKPWLKVLKLYGNGSQPSP